MKRPKLKLGQLVTVRERVEAYYSRYAGNPEIWLEPGDIAIVGAVDVPKVRRTPGGDYFACLDFDRNGIRYRASANYGNIVPASPCQGCKGCG